MELDRIGIPARLLRGEKGARIPIVHWADGLAALNKPEGVASRNDPWHGGVADLDSAFNEQIHENKPELAAHGITQFSSINPLEPEATGAVLSSLTHEARAAWKNEYGSFQFGFHFLIVCEKSDASGSVVECRLPINRHFKKRRMIISHQQGKKSYSRFENLARARSAEVWLGSTRFPRLHQMRLHACESGIPVLDDPIYVAERPNARSSSETGGSGSPWIHSYAIRADSLPGLTPRRIAFEPPRHWKRYLRRHGIELAEILSAAEQIIENRTLPIE